MVWSKGGYRVRFETRGDDWRDNEESEIYNLKGPKEDLEEDNT